VEEELTEVTMLVVRTAPLSLRLYVTLSGRVIVAISAIIHLHYEEVIVASVPLNVGTEIVPLGVPETETDLLVPVKLPSSLTAVPEKLPVAVAESTPVATVTAVPFVGRLPAEKLPADQPRVKFSFATVAVHAGNVQEGNVPTPDIGVTEVVVKVTVGLTVTEPAGV
jgi:hypothetical protein